MRLLTFEHLKWASLAHSTAYLGLLVTWALGLDGLKYWFGWAHGIGWIVMCLLSIAAVHRRVIPIRLAVAVSVIGAIGPFVGSVEFIRLDRRRRRAAAGSSPRYSQSPHGR
jgi:hypothetical protein